MHLYLAVGKREGGVYWYEVPSCLHLSDFFSCPGWYSFKNSVHCEDSGWCAIPRPFTGVSPTFSLTHLLSHSFFYLLQQGSKHTFLLLDFTPYYLLLLIHYSLYCQESGGVGRRQCIHGISNTYTAILWIRVHKYENITCTYLVQSYCYLQAKHRTLLLVSLRVSAPLINSCEVPRWPRPIFPFVTI